MCGKGNSHLCAWILIITFRSAVLLYRNLKHISAFVNAQSFRGPTSFTTAANVGLRVCWSKEHSGELIKLNFLLLIDA